MPFDQEVLVRVWRNVKTLKVLPTSHFGHAAVMLQGSMLTSGDVYISWWPGEGAGKKDALRSQRGQASSDPQSDEQDEMNKLTAIRLEVGYRKAQVPQIPYPSVWDDLMREYKRGPLNSARPGQTRVGGEIDYDGIPIPLWSQSPDEKISLPGLGAAGALWGLSTRRMASWWQNWKATNSYRLASSTNSCAGAAALALKAGGGEAFVNSPSALIFMEPVQIANWAMQLQLQIDRLNQATRVVYQEVLHAVAARELAVRAGAANDMHDGIWTLDAWKAQSSLAMKIRSPLLRKIDSALADYHKYDWTNGFEAKFKALVALTTHIIAHRQEKAESERKTAMLMLASQTILVLKQPPIPGGIKGY